MASKTLASLIIRVGADVSGALTGMTSVEKASRAIKREFTGLSASTIRYRSAMVALAGTAALGLVIKNSMEAQAANAQLGAVLKSTGGAAGQTMQSLDRMATALERTTTFGDEAVKSAQGLLLTFTAIKGGAFEQATKTVLDMATAMGGGEGGLKAASIQVGKALQDPIKGLTALRKVGVNFTDAQRDQIKVMVEGGRAAEAQAMILKELQVEFGGSAEAARKTLGGAIAFLNNQLGNFFEVSETGSGVFISAINSMGEAVIWAREKAMVPFFGGIQIMAADAAVWVGKLRVAWADLQVLLHGEEAMPAAGAARDSLKFLADAAAEVKAELLSGGPAFEGYARSVTSAAAAVTALTEAQRKLLAVGAGVTAPNTGQFGFGTPESLAKWKQAQELIKNGTITLFDPKPMVKKWSEGMDWMVADAVDAKDRMLSAAMMFRDGFADAIASAVTTGKLNFRSFADFVIAELIRIQVRKIFTDVLGSAVGGSSASSTSTPVTTTSGAASAGAMSFNVGATSAPPAVVHQTINFSVSAIDARDAARFVQEQKGAISQVVADAARGSSGFRRALAGA